MLTRNWLGLASTDLGTNAISSIRAPDIGVWPVPNGLLAHVCMPWTPRGGYVNVGRRLSSGVAIPRPWNPLPNECPRASLVGTIYMRRWGPYATASFPKLVDPPIALVCKHVVVLHIHGLVSLRRHSALHLVVAGRGVLVLLRPLQ